MKTVYIRLAGGLGNQVFQLGAALLAACHAGCDRIVLDDSALGNYAAQRQNELTKIFALEKLALRVEVKRTPWLDLRLPKLPVLGTWNRYLIGDRDFQEFLGRPAVPGMRWMDGYFQDCLDSQTFEAMTAALRPCFRVRKPLEGKNGECAVHIRGGDFLKLGWNQVTPPEYYQNALATMERLGAKRFIVLTDDPSYARELMSGLKSRWTIVSSDMVDDFYRLASAPFRILSGSTFSLWASELGWAPGDRVIAPQEWKPGFSRPFQLSGELQPHGTST